LLQRNHFARPALLAKAGAGGVMRRNSDQKTLTAGIDPVVLATALFGIVTAAFLVTAI